MDSKISLRFLGCGDAFGSGGNAQTCFYLQTRSADIMVDCGATSLVKLREAGLTSNDVDIICLTHFHGDHYGGVPFILLDAALVRNREKPLTIVSPPGGKIRIEMLLNQLYPGTDEKVRDLLDVRYEEFEGIDRVNLSNNFEIHTFPVVHSPESLPHGFKLRVEGKVLGFSGDTYWTDHLIEIARDTDVFVCECNFFDTDLPQHLNYRLLEKKRNLLHTNHLILNHLGEEMLENLKDVNIPIAKEGQEITL